MRDLVIARAIHVVAVVHWIGGVALVTLVILPALRRFGEASQRLELFDRIERRFAAQARISVTLAGLSGFYLVQRMQLWTHFLEPGYWWMHAMVLVWLAFGFVLFVAEPWFLHAWLHHRATTEPVSTFALIERGHRILLGFAALTVAAAVLGAHGLLY